MRVCLQSRVKARSGVRVPCLLRNRLFLFVATIISVGTVGGGYFVNLHLYPLFAASLKRHTNIKKHVRNMKEH